MQIRRVIALSLTLPFMAQAATTFSTGSPYPNNADMSETLSIQGASVVTVSGKTFQDQTSYE